MIDIGKLNLDDLSPVQLQEVQKLLTPKLTKYIPYTPTPKQRAFLLMNDVREVLYGGAAGGGKSVSQLMAALQYVDVPGYHAILFRKTFADLSLPGALIAMSKEWLSPYVNSGEVKWSDKEKRYTFPSGATLSFGYLENDNDCFRYQGSEFSYIGFDECTHISPTNFRYLFSRLRKPKAVDVPLRIRATCNPGGAYGEFYYDRYFIEGKDKGRVFIGAGLMDNPHLDADEYMQSLDELDAVTREQLLNGNWEIKENGEMFNHSWITFYDPGAAPVGTRWVRFWDLASTSVKKNKRADTTVGFKLGYYNGYYYIDDIKAIQGTPGEVEKLIGETAIEDGYTVAIRMEQEPGSSGIITIDMYAKGVLQGYDFKGIPSTGNKADRARPAAAAMERGQILMNRACRHRQKFFDQLDIFPKGAHDDFVDGLSGSFNYFRGSSVAVMSAPTALSNGGSYWRGA